MEHILLTAEAEASTCAHSSSGLQDAPTSSLCSRGVFGFCTRRRAFNDGMLDSTHILARPGGGAARLKVCKLSTVLL